MTSEDERVAAGLAAELRTLPGIGTKAAATVAAHLVRAEPIRAEALAAAHVARGILKDAHDKAREAKRAAWKARRSSFNEVLSAEIQLGRAVDEYLRDHDGNHRDRYYFRRRFDALSEPLDATREQLDAAIESAEDAEAAIAAALDDFEVTINNPAAAIPEARPAITEYRPRIVGCLHFEPVQTAAVAGDDSANRRGLWRACAQPKPELVFMVGGGPLGVGATEIPAKAESDVCRAIREDDRGGYVDLRCPTCGSKARPKAGSQARSQLLAAGSGRIECRYCGARLVDSRYGSVLTGTNCVMHNAERLLIEAPEISAEAAADRLRPLWQYRRPGSEHPLREAWSLRDREAVIAQTRERLNRLDRKADGERSRPR